jgi:trimeric autotransporter adhesin
LLFQRTISIWPSEATSEDSASIGINGDQGDNSTLNSGAVYVFKRDTNDAWSQITYLKAPNPQNSAEFGHSVAFALDRTLVIGARLENSNAIGINGNQDDDSAIGSGAVYLY